MISGSAKGFLSVWSNPLPKTMLSSSTPYNTTGIQWVRRSPFYGFKRRKTIAFYWLVRVISFHSVFYSCMSAIISLKDNIFRTITFKLILPNPSPTSDGSNPACDNFRCISLDIYSEFNRNVRQIMYELNWKLFKRSRKGYLGIY